MLNPLIVKINSGKTFLQVFVIFSSLLFLYQKCVFTIPYLKIDSRLYTVACTIYVFGVVIIIYRCNGGLDIFDFRYLL